MSLREPSRATGVGEHPPHRGAGARGRRISLGAVEVLQQPAAATPRVGANDPDRRGLMVLAGGPVPLHGSEVQGCANAPGGPQPVPPR